MKHINHESHGTNEWIDQYRCDSCGRGGSLRHHAERQPPKVDETDVERLAREQGAWMPADSGGASKFGRD